MAVFAIGGGSAFAADWGYFGDEAPAEWCGLDAVTNIACCEGVSQTPIDIASRNAIESSLADLNISYTVMDLVALNNGHTVQANVPDGAVTLEVGGKAYKLLQFHFHTPSEHFLNGQEFPVEMHLVHQAEDGAYLVLGVFIKAGAAHTELEKIWSGLPAHDGDMQTALAFDISKILPTVWNSYRYNGSLTTPPCTEGVSWVVFANPIEMSAAQISALKAIFSGAHFPDGNRRPLKSINGRIVVTDVPSDVAEAIAANCNTNTGKTSAADAGLLGGLVAILAGWSLRRRTRK